MARIYPFQPYRYSAKAGAIENLVTQPYDKISPAMQARYLSLSPYNLVRLILGERFPTDSDRDNVYTRSASTLSTWIANGLLERENAPSLYAYYQRFTVPDTGQTLERKGFIGLGALEEYSAGVVHRHEQTLSGPKKDRMELVRHTRAQFELLFLLYPDPDLTIDKILDAAEVAPSAVQPDLKKLLIADGHHRYETALAFRNENPGLADAASVPMTFVNMHSPGLEILATHRVVRGLTGFDPATFLAKVQGRRLGSLDELRQLFRVLSPAKIRIGIALPSGEIRLYERDRKPGDLDVNVLHQYLLGSLLGISEEAVRDEKHIEYVRGLDAAYTKVREGADAAFLLEPTTMEQVASVAFSGGVMPQKSTDFYPKLLSGLTIHKLER